MRGTIVRLVAFTLLCFSFTTWLAFTIGNVHGVAVGPIQILGHHTYELSATFDDSNGLLPDDNVKVAGVVVGKVTGVHLRDGRSFVTMRVNTNVQLPADSSASIRWRNLLGQRYVYLYPGRAGTALRGGDHIPRDRTRSVVDLGELFNRLGPIVKAIDPAKVNEFLRSFTDALDGNEAQLGDALHDLSLVAQTLGDRDAAVGRLVSNLDAVTGAIAARDQEIRTVVDNLTTLAGTFNDNRNVLVTANHDLNDFTNKLADLVGGNRASIDGALSDLAAIMQTVTNRLPEIDRSVANLDDAGSALYRASRYGEWLNQVIPCGAVSPLGPSGPTIDLETTCPVNTTSTAASNTSVHGGPAVSGILLRAMGAAA